MIGFYFLAAGICFVILYDIITRELRFKRYRKFDKEHRDYLERTRFYHGYYES